MNALERIRAAAMGPQWCQLHDCNQDDPAHQYTYPECEKHLRDVAFDPADIGLLLEVVRQAQYACEAFGPTMLLGVREALAALEKEA